MVFWFFSLCLNFNSFETDDKKKFGKFTYFYDVV